MGTTDTSERGLESLIVAAMTGHAAGAPGQDGVVREPSAPYGGTGWVLGDADVREAAIKLPDEADEPELLDDAEGLVEGDEDSEGADLDATPEEAEA